MGVHFSLAAFEQIGSIVAPMIMTALGVPAPVIPLVQHAIVIAQEAGGTGETKKATAMDAVATGLAAVNAVRPGTVDASAVTDLVSQGIDLTVAAIKEGQNIPVKTGTTQG
jgi:hypothetical protein